MYMCNLEAKQLIFMVRNAFTAQSFHKLIILLIKTLRLKFYSQAMMMVLVIDES